jgi:ABC-type glutathione transport system ATPase component
MSADTASPAGPATSVDLVIRAAVAGYLARLKALFGAAYVEVLTHALDAYHSMADRLLAVSENLGDRNADAYEATEAGNADIFQRMELPRQRPDPRLGRHPDLLTARRKRHP